MRRARLALLLLLGMMAVPLGAQAATTTTEQFGASLSGSQEVPPRQTPAGGSAAFRTSDGQSLKSFVVVQNISNVVAAHIHLGPPGENGPVVAFLYGPVPPGGGPERGLLAAPVLTAADLIGPLEGEPLSALLDAMRAGNTYVNVHTNDGVNPANTGPGDFPGGELRGQILPARR